MRFALILPLLASFAPISAQDLEEQATGLIKRNCLTCHSAAAKMGGLVLEKRELALQGGAHGPAIKPGDSAGSLLVQKTAAGKMPPGKPLPDAERQILARWVDAGAAWTSTLTAVERKRAGKDWWSLQPLKVSQPPAGTAAGWTSPIDRYLLAAMQTKGLKPSAPADRRTLIRRATFDLTGLPPTPEEVEAFANDSSADAYARLVDRLLASPAYGERWGRHWLDVIRFGESHGYEQNHLRPNAWPFRDYIIRSFNDDKPFDRLILEHLAGDVVANGDPNVEVGTGFLVAGPHDTVGNANEAASRQQRADDLDDMINATASAFLGLTVNCARCHDHKFDPIEQRDYYRMAAIFNGVTHGDREFASPAEKRRVRAIREPLELELKAANERLEAIRKAAAPDIAEQREEILSKYRPAAGTGLTREDFAAEEARFVRLKILGTTGGSAGLEELEVWSGARNVALASAGGKVTASSTRIADGSPDAYTPAFLIDGKFNQRWIAATDGAVDLTIELPVGEMVDAVSWSGDRAGGFKGKFEETAVSVYEVAISSDGREWKKVASSEGRLPSRAADREELLLLAVLDEPARDEYNDLKARRKGVQKLLDNAPKLPMVYAGRMRDPKEPAYLLKHGNAMDRGEVMVPESLSTLPFAKFAVEEDRPEGERRVALAQWLADPKNPLTPRVLANRLWHYHFGHGIVGTPGDFGFNGERPTHPELLDYLASRLIENGWRMKPLHREIMLSQAYQQSSAFDEGSARIDGDGRFLWRFPPRRLEAEEVRDTILSVTGKLDRRMGGPGFQLYRYTVDNVATYFPIEKFGPETWRRAVYQTAARSVPSELLGQYDCPDSSLPEPKRIVTTSPLQALALLNNAFLLDQAKFFAERLEHDAGADRAKQVNRAFELAFGRKAEAEETRDALQLIERYGLPAFCRAMLNTSELIYIR
ncbi:MAG TPA: DUF1553 domain-containing protein [Bryobacteraceae bacterium]|jgi:hypothetical protein